MRALVGSGPLQHLLYHFPQQPGPLLRVGTLCPEPGGEGGGGAGDFIKIFGQGVLQPLPEQAAEDGGAAAGGQTHGNFAPGDQAGEHAENTEDPTKYTSRVSSHYVMTVGKTITLADIMEGRA